MSRLMAIRLFGDLNDAATLVNLALHDAAGATALLFSKK
jgi:hypothetical protein